MHGDEQVVKFEGGTRVRQAEGVDRAVRQGERSFTNTGGDHQNIRQTEGRSED